MLTVPGVVVLLQRKPWQVRFSYLLIVTRGHLAADTTKDSPPLNKGVTVGSGVGREGGSFVMVLLSPAASHLLNVVL